MERLALITGASRGLGYALGPELAKRGYHVAALARTVGGLEELDDAIRDAGGAATLIPLDLTDDDALPRLGAAIHERWGGLDLWLHTAAQGAPLSPAQVIAEKDWDKVIAVNARATMRLMRMLEPLLRARQGRAVWFDDPQSGPFWGAYAASKSAARALWDCWEAGADAIRIATVLPPPMPTALRARFWPGEDRATLPPVSETAARVMAALEAQPDEGWIDLRA